MSEIKQCSFTFLLRVILNNLSLDITAHIYHMLKCICIQRLYAFCIVLKPVVIFLVFNKTMLNNLTKSRIKKSLTEWLKHWHVHIYKLWLVECSNHILICPEINACLAANTWINLGKKWCRNLYEFNSSKICCRRKSGKVANNSSSKCYKAVIPVKMILYKIFIYILYCVKSLILFSCCKCIHIYCITCFFKLILYLFCI